MNALSVEQQLALIERGAVDILPIEGQAIGSFKKDHAACCKKYGI